MDAVGLDIPFRISDFGFRISEGMSKPEAALSVPVSVSGDGARGLTSAQASFAAMLGRASAGEAGMTDAGRARLAAEQFVAQTFVEPLLKQFRQSDRTPPPFGPSQGEKQFRALMDAELAQRLVQAQRFPLVDRLAQDLLKRGGTRGS